MIGKDWTFKLSDTQYKKLEDWYNNLIKTKYDGDTYFGAIGGEVLFEILPTSIGEFVVVKFFDNEIDLSEV
jgi:hypothetical protein